MTSLRFLFNVLLVFINVPMGWQYINRWYSIGLLCEIPDFSRLAFDVLHGLGDSKTCSFVCLNQPLCTAFIFRYGEYTKFWFYGCFFIVKLVHLSLILTFHLHKTGISLWFSSVSSSCNCYITLIINCFIIMQLLHHSDSYLFHHHVTVTSLYSSTVSSSCNCYITDSHLLHHYVTVTSLRSSPVWSSCRSNWRITLILTWFHLYWIS